MSYVETVLDRATDPSQSEQTLKARKDWERRSPEEQVLACRQVLHGAIAPVFGALAEGEQIPASIDPKQFEKVIGMFEATLESYEQRSQQGSRRSSSSSS